MKFKPLSAEGHGTIYRLLAESYDGFLRKNPQYREAWQRDWREYDSDVFRHPDTVGECGFSSYAGDALIGFASYDPRRGPARAVIGHHCILPAYQGNGYGRLQMRELLQRLKQRGFRKAVVATGGHEFFASAILMYKTCGFKETGKSHIDAGSGLRTIELEYDLTLIVRKAGIDDFEQVFALFHQLWPGKKLDRERLRSVYTAMLETDGYELLCAERGGKVAGFASVSVQHNFWQEGRIAYLTTLIVDDAVRNRGIGTMLINEILELAEGQGCSKLELESAFHRREAHEFYEKMGFEKRAYFFSKDMACGRKRAWDRKTGVAAIL